jgi:two-component system NarL family response regulator
MTAKPHISPRQLQILRLVSRGSTDKQIAGDLGISENTVKSHIKQIFVKLKSSSRAQACTVFFSR